MSIRSTPPTPHLDDVELVRFIDQEGSPEEQGRWNAHLQACGRCRDEAAELGRKSDAVSGWLAAADFDTGAVARPAADRSPPRAVPHAVTRRRSSWSAAARGPWLKAAVFVLLLAAPLAAFPGVREWVGHRLAGVESAPPPAPSTAAAPDQVAAFPRVRFVPAPGTFAMVLDAAQAGGTLSVGRVQQGDEAVLDVAGPGPLPEPVISARSVRIGNTAALTASYSLRLPREVESLAVTIGGRVIHLDTRALDAGAVIPLNGP